MRYFKSIYTGTVYECDTEPKFGGYVEVTKQEYIDYMVSHGLQMYL